MATGMITVPGQRGSSTDRSMPDPKSPFYDVNTGWVFLSGTESQP